MSSTSAQAATAEIKVLSAGAIKTGLANLAKAFHEEGGHKVIITFATAPVLRDKVEKDEAAADIVIAPIPTMKGFEDSGRVVAGSMAVLGRVRAAVVVRAGVPEPDISTAEALKKEILAARSLVYNQASSGLYVEKLMDHLGIAGRVKAKTTRVPTGGAVMKHLASSKTENEIGFGQVPEILVYKDQGVKLVGPLPKEIENVTTYAAGLLVNTSTPEPAEKFIRFLATLYAKETFSSTGVE